MLVVAADESVMPQTREHFEICRLLQVPAGVIVLTKADLADADTLDWRARSARADRRVVPRGRADRRACRRRPGRASRRCAQALVAVARRRRGRGRGRAAPRLPIDRVFTVQGLRHRRDRHARRAGRCARRRARDPALGERRVKVRGLQVHGEARTRPAAGTTRRGQPGRRRVGDIGPRRHAGAPGSFEHAALRRRVDLLPDATPLRHGARVRFHHGTDGAARPRVRCRGVGRGGDDGAPSGPGAPARGRRRRHVNAEIAAGGHGYVRLRLESPAVLTRGDRFILRSYLSVDHHRRRRRARSRTSARRTADRDGLASFRRARSDPRTMEPCWHCWSRSGARPASHVRASSRGSGLPPVAAEALVSRLIDEEVGSCGSVRRW